MSMLTVRRRYPRRGSYGSSSSSRYMMMKPYGRRRMSRKMARSYTPRTRKYTGLPRLVNSVMPTPELKYFDTFIPGGTVSNAGTFYQLLTPAQGTGSNAIIGNSASTRYITAKYSIRQGAAPTNCAWRVLFIYDRQPVTASPGLPATAALLATSGPTSPLNLQYKDRFVILASEEGSLSVTGNQITFVDMYRRVDMQTSFPLVNTGPSTPPTTGALLLFFISDQASGSGAPVFFGNIRVRYVDA